MVGSPVANHSDPSQLTRLLSVAIAVLRQAIDFVDNVLTSDEQLIVPSKYVAGSTIGAHILDISRRPQV
jgi:hypothetical protein